MLKGILQQSLRKTKPCPYIHQSCLSRLFHEEVCLRRQQRRVGRAQAWSQDTGQIPALPSQPWVVEVPS